MQALLERLNSLPGVLGSMRCDAAGQPVSHALPAEQFDGELRAAARAAADSLRALGDAAGVPVHLDLSYSQRRVLVVPAGTGSLVLLCEKTVNPRAVLPKVADLLRSAAPVVERTPAPVPSDRPVSSDPFASFAQPAPSRERPTLADQLFERTPVSGPAVEHTPAPARPAPAPRSTAPAAPPAAATARKLPGPALLAAGAVALLALVAVSWWAVSRSGSQKRPGLEETAGAQAAAGAATADGPASAAAAQKVILRIGGAKSFAAELAPALAKGYLESLEARDVQIQKLDAGRATISGERDRARLAIVVEGMPTPDGFDQLASGRLDVAMAGRRIKPEWQAKLDAQGPMMVPGREHVVALSGVAVIVNPANLVPQLTRDQLAAVFSGAVTDWSALGGRSGPINVYAGDDRMGLTDLFRTLVLQKREYGPEVKRLATLQELTDAVALDPQGVAYVTLPFVRGTRAVPLAEGDAAALVPTAFTLATEDYLLTHRLYFYVLPRPDDPHAVKFVQFALGTEGQAIVKRSGYVELSVASAPREPPTGAPARYVQLTAGATRLSSTFRFEPGSSDFDVRALVDVDRVSWYLVENRLNGSAVRVLGFADAMGKHAVNLQLSAARAEQVARALAQRGITGVAVEGFGSALPVATNATADGRERNRRVEVWVAR